VAEAASEGRAGAVPLSDAVLDDHALPAIRRDDDKEARGRVVVVAGSAQTPGAAILAGLAALRAGAGKLQLVTAASVATQVAVAVPEARVVPQPETAAAGLQAALDDELRAALGQADSVLLGPGLLGGVPAVAELLAAVLAAVGDGIVVLDAAAVLPLADAPELLRPLDGRAVLTPNPDELATLEGCEPRPVGEGDPEALRVAAARLGAAIASGPVAGDAELVARISAGGPGLGTSGSGDVLAGVVAGLAARGATPRAAALWGAYVHARAGDRLAERVGPVGYLARELLDEVPRELGLATARLRG
jgi:hydroxyethylthiazole kinase-like uncharacterized protein yjeF